MSLSPLILNSRVLNEDEDFIILEVAKKPETVFHLNPAGGDIFLSMCFVRTGNEPGMVIPWIPWRQEEQQEP